MHREVQIYEQREMQIDRQTGLGCAFSDEDSQTNFFGGSKRDSRIFFASTINHSMFEKQSQNFLRTSYEHYLGQGVLYRKLIRAFVLDF
jgi:hypothetical protein